MAKMKAKLAANADHFGTEALRIAYIQNRVGGRAADHFAPCLRETAKQPYISASDIFKHLETVYLDPNRVLNAKRSFRQLRIKETDRFQYFLTTFMHLAAESEALEEDYKEELYNKLTDKLQELTISHRVTDTSFEEFSRYCSQVANSLQSIASRTRTAAAAPKSPTTTSITTSSSEPSEPSEPKAYGASTASVARKSDIWRVTAPRRNPVTS